MAAQSCSSVVERVLGADLAADPALLLAARGGEHACGAQLTRQLDRRHADTAGAALHQQGFAARKAAEPDHVVPGGEEHLGQGRRFDESEIVRDRHALRRRHGTEFGVTAAGHDGADSVAGARPSDIGGSSLDDAGNVEPRQIGSAGRRRVEPLALLDVGTVHARRQPPAPAPRPASASATGARTWRAHRGLRQP